MKIELDFEWIVNEYGEIGIHLGNQFIFLYKGEPFQYSKDSKDSPKFYRRVGKREFGESGISPLSNKDMAPDEFMKLVDRNNFIDLDNWKEM